MKTVQWALGATAMALVLFLSLPVLAQECGDVVGGSDGVHASDALAVLRKAVGLASDLQCSGECAAVLARVEELESRTRCMRATQTDTYFDGCNVHVQNGTGTTDGPVNGLGNLIVGYDENGGRGASGGVGTADDKSGSHNLVVGRFHTYASYGGLLAGEDNLVNAAAGTASAGWRNQVFAPYSAISGGTQNETYGDYAAVSGGRTNIAVGEMASVSAGDNNVALAVLSSLSGGCYSMVAEDAACGSVSGGIWNTVRGKASTVCGGEENIAGEPGEYELQGATTIVGGFGNKTEGKRSTVVGGVSNIASGELAAVLGGAQNLASGQYATATGGASNTASGRAATVGGGAQRTAPGQSDWAAGGLFQDE